MNPENQQAWQEVKKLFHSCLDLPPAERKSFLLDECKGDLEIQEEVLSLLSFHEDPQTLISTGAQDLFAAQPEEALERYQLLDVLGQGGMGIVYRAKRADGAYEDEVAIKLLHRDLVTDRLVQRFWQERQILANLKHPAIARLIDGGTFEDGRPFLVMEYVDGVSIDRYCDQHQLPIRQRLRLFAKVCRAVHFAHQNLVVHRDLKPGNILVDAQGGPKLLDFGVAKLLDPTAPNLTHLGPDGGASPLTPDFASPEQVSGKTITTASDVYALGALLYLLLTGTRPLRSEGLALSAFVEAVCHQEPALPSQRVGEVKPPSTEAQWLEAARARGTASATQLKGELTGDLDRIVAKALSKDPVDRYPSAEDLARDLDRHLDGKPVMAREPTVVYRVGKFLRRHRWPSLLAAAVTLALVGLSIGLLLQRNRLLEEEALSREVTSFLEGLFEVSTPESGLGQPVLARQLLDQGAFDVRYRFSAQPRLKARLVSTMGRAYLSLGHHQEAEDLLAESLATRRELFDAPHPELVDGLLDQGDLFIARGNYEKAEKTLQEARQSAQQTRLRQGEKSLRALLGLARIQQVRGDYESALELHQEALGMAESLFGIEHERYALALLGLSEVRRLAGDFDAAQEDIEQARSIYHSVYGKEHPEVARLGLQVGLLFEEQGRLADAEAALRKALSLQSKLYPDTHPELAETLNNLASVVFQQNRFNDAEQLCRQGLDLRRAALEEDHPAIGGSLNLLGLILWRQDRTEEAEESFREARTRWTRKLGPDHVHIAAVNNNLAQILHQRGDLAGAERELLEALRINRVALGEEHLQTATVLNNLGFLRKLQDDFLGALKLYEQARPSLERNLGPKHPRTAHLYHNLAVLLDEMGEAGNAEPLFRKSLEGFTESLQPQHPNLALVRKNLAGALNKLGRADEAETLLEEALEMYRAAGQGEDDLAVFAARGYLADTYVQQERFEDAANLLRNDLRKGIEHHGEGSQVVERTRKRLKALAEKRR